MPLYAATDEPVITTCSPEIKVEVLPTVYVAIEPVPVIPVMLSTFVPAEATGPELTQLLPVPPVPNELHSAAATVAPVPDPVPALVVVNVVPFTTVIV